MSEQKQGKPNKPKRIQTPRKALKQLVKHWLGEEHQGQEKASTFYLHFCTAGFLFYQKRGFLSERFIFKATTLADSRKGQSREKLAASSETLLHEIGYMLREVRHIISFFCTIYYHKALLKGEWGKEPEDS